MFPKLSAVFAVAVIRKRNAREEKKTTILLILEIFLDISYNIFIMYKSSFPIVLIRQNSKRGSKISYATEPCCRAPETSVAL